MLYFIVDGEYPQWPIFIEAERNTSTLQGDFFSKSHEATRHEVAELFKSLKKCFQLLYTSSQHGKRELFILRSNKVIISHKIMVWMDI